MTDADRDLLFVATTAFAEASGDGPADIEAVCWSIVNRHKANRWYSGATLAACCVIPSQYSSWNTGDRNRRRALETAMENVTMRQCFAAAAAAIARTGTDPTDGATHYLNPDAVASMPSWTSAESGAVMTKKIGAHVFYKNVA